MGGWILIKKETMTNDLQTQIRDLQMALEQVSAGGGEVLNFDQCMKLTGFSKGLLYRMTSQREIPHYKKGKFVFFKRSEVESWLFECKIKTQEEIEREVEQRQINKAKKKGELKNG